MESLLRQQREQIKSNNLKNIYEDEKIAKIALDEEKTDNIKTENQND